MEKLNVNEPKKVVPQISANVLLHFMGRIRFLKTALKERALFPRYCVEDISYLKLDSSVHNLVKVAYPEKCFCDIPIHEVYSHTSHYGPYGIALPKVWGIEHGIQPIQYVNPNSSLIRDFREAFAISLEVDDKNIDAQRLSSYLVSHMLYIKPLRGKNRNRITDESEDIYFTDECEWRYVPDLTQQEMEMILFDNHINKKDENDVPIMDKYNEALQNLSSTWLTFQYDDIKYITVSNHAERDELIDYILELDNGIEEKDKLRCISKIIVLEDAKEDF